MEQLTDRGFVDFDHTSASPDAAEILRAVSARFGRVPRAVARMVASPKLYRAFMGALAVFDRTSLDPLERETVALTMGRVVGCAVCTTLHRATLEHMNEGGLAEDLFDGRPPQSPRLAALATFTEAAFTHRGNVPEREWSAFSAHYTKEQALEVLVGVGAYVMSTFANRLTAAPVDETSC